MEKKLLNIFKNIFIIRKDYGLEYFEGDFTEMVKIIFQETNEEIIEEINEETIEGNIEEINEKTIKKILKEKIKVLNVLFVTIKRINVLIIINIY